MKHYNISKNHYNSKEERELFLKKIYDYCMNVGWKKAKLDELAKLLDVDRAQVRFWARQYAYEYLSYDEYVEINQLIDKLTKQDREITKLTLPKYNQILYHLKRKKTYLLWENEEEKELVLKYIYDLCEEYIYDSHKIDEFSVWLGVTSSSIENYAKQYAVEYLGISNEQWHENRVKYGNIRRQKFYKNRDNNSKQIYENLLKAKSLEEIILIIESSDFDVNVLYSQLANYVIVHQNCNLEIKELLKSKLKMYSDYISKQKKDDRLREMEKRKEEKIKSQLLIAKEMVKGFIDDTKCNTIDIFCKINNIDRNVFSNYVSIVKENDVDLFNLYNKKVKGFQSQRYAIIVDNVKLVIKYLKNGVEEYGLNRPFDLIDYYMITNMSLNDLLRLSKDIVTKEEHLLLKKFVNQNISGEKNNPSVVKQIMSEMVIMNYQKDKKGFPIPGTEEIFSNEEKEKLINYLRRNNIPINLKTYSIVFRKYKNGMLDLEQNLIKK